MRSILLSVLLVVAALSPALANPQSKRSARSRRAPAHVVAPAPVPAMRPETLAAPAPAAGTPLAESAIAPPAPMREVRPPAPPDGHAVWVAGYWGWENARFVWNAGSWQEPPSEGQTWIPARWEARAQGWTLIAGGWGLPREEPAPFVAQPGRAHMEESVPVQGYR